MSPIVIGEQVRIPAWVVDLASFRRWACSEDFPEHGWFAHLKGELWVDLSMEKLKHNQIKGEISRIIGNLVKAGGWGLYLYDRMLLTNIEAELSTEPDGMFLSHTTIATGRAILEEGDDSLDVLGTPDMVLEVVSKNSVQKDTVVLPELYWKAGIPEYWLVDTRDEEPTLDIRRHAARKYVSRRTQAGWLKSAVFGQAFQLRRQAGAHGFSQYTLAIR